MDRTTFNQGQVIDELTLDMSDDELQKLIKDWKVMSEKSTSQIKKDWADNKNYYIGKDPLADGIIDNKSKVVDNRIFTNVETIVPMVTSKPAKPVVFLPKDQGEENDDKIREQAIKSQRILMAIYKDQKLQQQFEKLIRQHQLCKVGVIKYGIKDGKIFALVTLPTRLLLDSEATNIYDSEFIGEKVVTTAKKLIDRFPEKEDNIKQKVNGHIGTKVTYIEWWTNDFVVFEYDGIILEKKKNPLFDYDGVTTESTDEFGKVMKKTTKNNYFNSPKIPYIPFNVYNLGESLLDDITALDLCTSLQDDINQRKRQIADNADKVGNPIRTGKGFTQEQIGMINDNLGAGDAVGLTDDQDLGYVQAAPLPSHILNSLQDSRNSIDNIFGIHSTTRGERTGDDSGIAREKLREGDEDRQATIGRALETLSEELYSAFAHLIKVFYDKPQLLPLMGEDNTDEYLEFKRDDLAEGMKIVVKPGSTLPDDPIARKAQAMELAQMGKISTKKLYDELGIEDPDQVLEELELEGVKAEMRQQEEANKAKEKVNQEQEVQGLEQAIEQLGGQAPVNQ